MKEKNVIYVAIEAKKVPGFHSTSRQQNYLLKVFLMKTMSGKVKSSVRVKKTLQYKKPTYHFTTVVIWQSFQVPLSFIPMDSAVKQNYMVRVKRILQYKKPTYHFTK